jgi:CheY-like chemotaxis protein
LKELKPSVKILAQTAYATNEEHKKAIAAGCDEYISKPLSKEILFDKINSLLQSKSKT